MKCPVCSASLGFEPWRGESASHEICPSCGIQFGLNDWVADCRELVHQEWRNEWVANGEQPFHGEEWRQISERVASKIRDLSRSKRRALAITDTACQTNFGGSLDELEGIMIEDCWVLSWAVRGSTLEIKCELSLWQPNPNYEKPKNGEWTCYKHGTIGLPGIKDLSSIEPMQTIRPIEDPNGDLDYGSLDSIVIEGGEVTVVGPFGRAKGRLKDFHLEYCEPI